MNSMSQHTEWLSLIEVSGPFLAISVLEKVFPQGLDAVETQMRKRTRLAYNQWCDAVEEDDPQLAALHRAWIYTFVLEETLEFENTVLLPVGENEQYTYKYPDGNGRFTPDYLVRSEPDEKPMLLISIFPQGTDLEKVRAGDDWPASIFERMTLLCRMTGVRLGLITNGERWMLVNAPIGNTSSHASWYARLWFQEPVTFKAFQSLLGVRRWFGPEQETLPAMIEESLQHHEEVTDTLGEQVKRAVEVLIQCLDKADQDRNRELLHDVPPAELYEAGLTVMMRLVFILCAEERGLLLLNDPTYDQYYAISTLRGQLAEESDQHGPEVLERRHDAWARLLAVFRAIYGGVAHENLQMPALGGSIFDPDRFPFLEGRARGTCWRDTPAHPLPIDNRTVLLLLNALQVLKQRGGTLLLSYKALDVEQIGHVYEGLLEHTVQRLHKDTLGLAGSQKAKNPNANLAELESAYLEGANEIAEFITSITNRGLPAIKKALNKEVDEETFGKILAVSGGDLELASRIRPFSHLLRTDAWGDFIVYRAGSFAVALGADRRETGTHYTPKSLTESIVETTLEPISYIGPAEGTPREQWQLKPSSELLDLKICDPAMGSGAFLVQVCRWLSERLVEAWGKEMSDGKFISVDGVILDESGVVEPMPDSLDDRLLIARRLVAERCLYGVDMNPLAVELAKLSIWLITLAKGRPFGFLDHNLRSGDSLLGLHKLSQLTEFSLNPEKKRDLSIFTSSIENTVTESMELRKKLREIPIRDIRDIQYMERLDRKARNKLINIEHIADAMIGAALASGGKVKALEMFLDSLSTRASEFVQGNDHTGNKIIAEAINNLSIDLPAGKSSRKPFHWVLEFPEVFKCGGFDGIVGNPPFMGGQKITGSLGTYYRNYLVTYLANNKKGSADLCAYFFLRNAKLLNDNCHLGMLATNTISQGDTREVGLKQLEKDGFSFPCAVPSKNWPGKATLEVAIVWLKKGCWLGSYQLENSIVNGITSYLTVRSEINSNPHRLNANKYKAYQGSIVLGMGFILDPEEAHLLITKKPINKEVLFPYLSGKDLNSRSDQTPSRWAINFFDWPLKRENLEQSWETSGLTMRKNFSQDGIMPNDYPGPVAADYLDCLSIVKNKVKPERLKLKGNSVAIKRKRYWWHYGAAAKTLYLLIQGLNTVMVRARTSNIHSIAIVPNGQVFNENIIVFIKLSFAVLQSSIHEAWIRRYSNTLRKDLQYSPSNCLESFPFPSKIKPIQETEKAYLNFRTQIMKSNNKGLTAIYNSLNNREESSSDIQRFRELHAEMDNSVAFAYGWDDLDLSHGFHETKQGLRFTISEDARLDVLQRLLNLNHERYEEEVKQGLHNKKKKTSKPRKKIHVPAEDDRNMDLFNFIEKSRTESK